MKIYEYYLQQTAVYAAYFVSHDFCNFVVV
jgi:hypothetical protein